MSIPTSTREYSIGKIGDYKTLVLRDTPLELAKSTEVLVKIHAVSLQYRDLAIAKGTYGLSKLEDGLVPGSDMAGEIISIGADVEGWAIGDRVSANFCHDHLHGDPTPAVFKSALGGGGPPGVLREYRAFPAHALVAIPDALSYEEASTLPSAKLSLFMAACLYNVGNKSCAAVTAYNALNGPIRVKAGDQVLVLGTGGVSTFGLQFALASGATVIVTSSSDKKLEIVKALGAHHTINYKTKEDWDAEVLRITGGRGVDHIIEVGGGTLPKSINAVRMGGSIHLIGNLSSDALGVNPFWSVVLKSAHVRGVAIGSISLFKDMLRLIVANPKVATPVVDRVFAFEDGIAAYAYLEAQKHIGKVVIRVS